ncbi:HAD hydrolase family protein [Spirosoma sp. HMF3257]|uniref:3-deoxy-D-manno-octulosonate 8-phosphate phosphatase n=1 Tax=Spirosoma telluris TaxID=2183553 RepID=A0A327NUV4_9BACT|nr:HAD hydrolase family protein [Spirosoma telluris]RAI78373.1 3-deoxy-D-manno-octulosonate 8-phosphate phosphatase [Spirosoma telluris]
MNDFTKLFATTNLDYGNTALRNRKLQTNLDQNVLKKAARIKLLLTDCDGVLTDAGVYYGENGEVLKKFNIRDGMGVERLRKLANVDTGIITGETSPSVVARAAKLKITELHLGCKDKLALLPDILTRTGLDASEVAFIGDDVNDLEIQQAIGFSACPADAARQNKAIVDYCCNAKGGEGCLRELAELIIDAKQIISKQPTAIPAIYENHYT